VVNDLHAVDRKCNAWLEGVVKLIKGRPEKPGLCLIAGDLSEHGTAKQLTGVRDVFKETKMPVKVVIGNHDWKNNTDRKAFEQTFPDSLNYTFEHGGWQFVAFDSSHGTRARVAVQPGALKWLDDKLPKLDRKKPLVVLTHFPLGPKVPNRLT